VEDITVEDIKGWQKLPVTQLFLRYVQDQKNDWDRMVHQYLRVTASDPEEAMKANVAMDTLNDVMEIPEVHMIPDIKEEDES